MNNLGQRIKAIRQSKGLSQCDVEKKTGIKREYLSKIENGALTNLTYSTIQKICLGLDISIAKLLDPEESTRPEPIIVVTSTGTGRQKISQSEIGAGEFVCIPVVQGEIAAGNPITINEKDIQEYVLAHSHFVKHTSDYNRYRCIRIKKDSRSMSPVIEPGSMVCIDAEQYNPDVLDGHIVAMKDENGDCTIKRLKTEKNFTIGIPENIKEYAPIVIPKSKRNPILGKVVWFWTQFEH